MQPPYARVPTSPPLVPYDAPPKVPGPKNKKRRKRLDPRQVEALNEMYTRTEYPSTEQREQLAGDLKMTSRKVQVWLVHFYLHHKYNF
jgi:homeobox protein YOX1/YHP1